MTPAQRVEVDAESARLERLDIAKTDALRAGKAFDTALQRAEQQFHKIEDAFERVAANGGARTAVPARRWLLTRAAWANARDLSARLGLARSPGGPSKNAKLFNLLNTQLQVGGPGDA